MATAEAAFAALMGRVTHLEGAVGTLTTTLAQISGALSELDRRVSQGTNSSRAETGFVATQEFKSMSTYSGEHKEFHSWYWQLKGRLSSHHKLYKSIMTWIDELTESPSASNFDDTVLVDIFGDEESDARRLCCALWNVICMRTGTKVETMLQNLEDMSGDL